MNDSRLQRLRAAALRTTARTAFGVAFILALCAAAAAQPRRAGQSPPPPPPNMNPSIRERQMKMTEMEREMNRPRAEREGAALALAEIGEDYERIQVVNNRMMAAVFSAPAPDYGSVASATAEIGKRAGRLKSNLHLPPPPAESAEKRTAPAEPPDAASMKRLLLALDKSLMSFVKSPVFESVGVMDARAAARARADLEAVIELSHFISKSAGRMAKAAGKR